MLAACGGDPCRDLCQATANRLETCQEEWGTTWEDLGAGSKREFRTGCQNAWDTYRADLEARQVPAAEDACTVADDDLGSMTCDELRALYF